MNDDGAWIEVERDEDCVVVRLHGEIDLSNVDSVEQRIEVELAGFPHVVIDLADIEYIDSQGLRLLNQLSKRLAREGSRFQLIAPPGSFVRGILDLTLISEDIEVLDAAPG
jgi:stage II sporulation protein AA (anti-sigma F factor antagonist)